MNKKAQVTMFIIVAVLLTTAILGILFFSGGKEEKKPKEVSPEQFIKGCVRDAVGDKIQVALDNGGMLEQDLDIMYKDENYTYLCYQADYYQTCYNRHPSLEQELEQKIAAETITQVQNCFNIIKEDYEDRGFTVTGDTAEYSIDILPGYIQVELKKNVEITDGEASYQFKNFDTRILTSLYDLMRIARVITNAESEFCHFGPTGYMLLYPEYSIKKRHYRHQSRLYWVEDRNTKEEFRFAVRSCALRLAL